MCKGQPSGVERAQAVCLAVTETDSVVKGKTAAGCGKPEMVEPGLRVIVPAFINVGDRIKVSTESGEYMERADH